MINPLQMECIRTALRVMWDKGYFDICTIDNILKVTGGIPDRKNYDALRLLHCVHFKDMSRNLRLELPRMVQLVVESEPMPTLTLEMPLALPRPVSSEDSFKVVLS